MIPVTRLFPFKLHKIYRLAIQHSSASVFFLSGLAYLGGQKDRARVLDGGMVSQNLWREGVIWLIHLAWTCFVSQIREDVDGVIHFEVDVRVCRSRCRINSSRRHEA